MIDATTSITTARAPAIKVCGVCHATDASYATTAGAAYIGVILASGFSRTRTVAEAAHILASAGASRRVGVFVDADADEITPTARMLQLDVVQLHGDEPAAVIDVVRDAVRCEVWKSVRVREAGDLDSAAAVYAAADALLLEGSSSRGSGGVGAIFDWSVVRDERLRLPATMRVIVAGGLTAANVAAMIPVLTPDVVDVSSGVESSIGRKSPEQVAAFIAAVAARGPADD